MRFDCRHGDPTRSGQAAGLESHGSRAGEAPLGRKRWG